MSEDIFVSCITGYLPEYDRYTHEQMYNMFSDVFEEGILEKPDEVDICDNRVNYFQYQFISDKVILKNDHDNRWGLVYHLTTSCEPMSINQNISFERSNEIKEIMEKFGISPNDIKFQSYVYYSGTDEPFYFIKGV